MGNHKTKQVNKEMDRREFRDFFLQVLKKRKGEGYWTVRRAQ